MQGSFCSRVSSHGVLDPQLGKNDSGSRCRNSMGPPQFQCEWVRFNGSGVQSESVRFPIMSGLEKQAFLQFCTQGFVVVVGCRNIDPTMHRVGAHFTEGVGRE